jgi:hypothetical protein
VQIVGCTAHLILDNHSAHISKETGDWLATRPTTGFEFTFTPVHGSWLNLIEGFFSKFARSVLRHIRVASKQELKDRIMVSRGAFRHDPELIATHTRAMFGATKIGYLFQLLGKTVSGTDFGDAPTPGGAVLGNAE